MDVYGVCRNRNPLDMDHTRPEMNTGSEEQVHPVYQQMSEVALSISFSLWVLRDHTYLLMTTYLGCFYMEYSDVIREGNGDCNT